MSFTSLMIALIPLIILSTIEDISIIFISTSRTSMKMTPCGKIMRTISSTNYTKWLKESTISKSSSNAIRSQRLLLSSKKGKRAADKLESNKKKMKLHLTNRRKPKKKKIPNIRRSISRKKTSKNLRLS